jgi:hypothetical protein
LDKGIEQIDFFPDFKSFQNKEESYTAYAQLFGDCDDSRQFQFEWGKWVLVGHGQQTNSKCGQFLTFKICNRVELHKQTSLDGVSHGSEVFVRPSHYWCNNCHCPVCFLHGWAKRLADHAAQRLEKASKGYVDEKGFRHAALGSPQHIVVSPNLSDYGLVEFHNKDFLNKAKVLLNEVGVLDGCIIFHGMRYADYHESLRKGVPFGWRWNPHLHVVGFISGGYGKCRHCKFQLSKTFAGCSTCDGFEHRVRESYKTNGYIIKCLDERTSVFGTIWYEASHMTVEKERVNG